MKGPRTYRVKQEPVGRRWFVLGRAGRGLWLVVAGGFDTRAQAIARARHQRSADAAARAELSELAR